MTTHTSGGVSCSTSGDVALWNVYEAKGLATLKCLPLGPVTRSSDAMRNSGMTLERAQSQ